MHLGHRSGAGQHGLGRYGAMKGHRSVMTGEGRSVTPLSHIGKSPFGLHTAARKRQHIHFAQVRTSRQTGPRQNDSARPRRQRTACTSPGDRRGTHLETTGIGDPDGIARANPSGHACMQPQRHALKGVPSVAPAKLGVSRLAMRATNDAFPLLSLEATALQRFEDLAPSKLKTIHASTRLYSLT